MSQSSGINSKDLYISGDEDIYNERETLRKDEIFLFLHLEFFFLRMSHVLHDHWNIIVSRPKI